MILKTELGVEIFINDNGMITLCQHDELTYEDKYIVLSPNQFGLISGWAHDNYEKIIEAWNDGIVKEDDDETNS